MPVFTSTREKKLWLWSLAVLAAIFSTLFVGQPLLKLFGNQNIQAVIFMFGMLLVGGAMLAHGLKTQPGKIEWAILLGIVAVYFMLFLRLGLPERSHLIEYSVLAIFVHMALMERRGQENQVLKTALLAFLITFATGVLDECLQIFLPDRVFDLTDMVFNGLAGLMAIGARVILQWVRKKIRKN